MERSHRSRRWRLAAASDDFQSYSNFNNIGVRGYIQSGAPRIFVSISNAYAVLTVGDSNPAILFWFFKAE